MILILIAIEAFAFPILLSYPFSCIAADFLSADGR
jgi:hypothetical protein